MIQHLLPSFLIFSAGIGGVLANSQIKSSNRNSETTLDSAKVNNPETTIANDDDISLEEVAAISAAIIKKIFSVNAVVKKVRFLNDSASSNWVNIGRNNIMSSHQFARIVK